MTQKEALTILKTGANVFLTGEPGAGKTHTINEYVEYLRSHAIEPAITASTGIAATHIGGLTIHSWSGIGIKSNLTKYDLDKIASSEYIVRRVSKTKVLIIDEVSMLSPNTLSMVDAVCREIKQSSEAFGGMQVIFVGDFFQLPPITRNEEAMMKKKAENAQQEIQWDEDMKDGIESSTGRFAYNSPAWVRARPIVCYLSEQYRQDDSTFLGVLSAIRKNNFDKNHMAHIEKRKVSYADSQKHYPKLFSHNVDVDRVNMEMLGKIDAPEQNFQMRSEGNTILVSILTKGCLSPEMLTLKVGAHVMCTKNNQTAGYVNGTQGIVTSFERGNGYPIIRTNDNKIITIEPKDWTVEENGKVKASITQVPLRLAWAITVHKSQGMSMDKAVMDLSEVFEYGQGYVALSRVRNLKGLHVLGWNDRAFQVHPEVLEEDESLRALSAGARESFSKLSRSEVEEMHTNFILACGGELKESSIVNRKSGTKPKKIDTKEVTLALWNEGKDVYEIADVRGLSAKTIWGHVEELVGERKITHPALKRIITPAITKMLPEVSKTFKKLDTDKLSPVFEHFAGKYSYDDIRIVRMLINNL
jgi:ATP-dependent DNA helicase PIF1